MLTLFLKKFTMPFFALMTLLQCSPSAYAGQDFYSSNFINQSNQAGLTKYTLIKTRTWPEVGCVVESGKMTIFPGESTQLVIQKKKGCDEAGIGYSLYKTEDINKVHLLGYVSHRFRDGKFSLQVSIFCQGNQCVFKDLNPDQPQ